MGFDANRADLCIGVIGTGAMGRGIVQVAAAGGMHVLMMDTRAGAADEARDFVAKMLSRAAEKGSMTPADADAATARIKVAQSLADFKACHMVVEAIVENLDAKRALFGELEDVVSADCILATNTSSMSVTTIAAKLKTPQRFAGFHFFNPVPLMKLVEVIDGLQTDNWVSEALMVIGKRMTREPDGYDDGGAYLAKVIAPRELKGRDLSRAIAATMAGSSCRHEHDCCGCPSTSASVKRTSAREYSVHLRVSYNY